jgi:dTDP-4-dehydrorhamnose 3,5-epimerase
MAEIEGVRRIPLVRHADDRGYLIEVLRASDPHFDRFGQMYVSYVRRGIIKAWHAHQRQTDRMYVVAGTSKIGLYDGRPSSPTFGRYAQVILGDTGEDALLIIPPLVWHGQMSLSEATYLINLPTEVYDPAAPDELRMGLDELEDIWTVRNR